MPTTRVLIAGDGNTDIHEKALLAAFQSLSAETRLFAWHGHFRDSHLYRTKAAKQNPLLSAYYRAQNKYLWGPALSRLNRELVTCCAEFKPDLVLLYRGTHVFRSSVLKIKSDGAKVFGSNNDDPFSPRQPRYAWRHFLASVPEYDHMLSYRLVNIDRYREVGCPSVGLWRSYYINSRNFPIETRVTNEYNCDVLFVGHFEDDGRDENIKAIVDAGIDFKLFGPEWDHSRYAGLFRERLGPIRNVFKDYNLALNSCKIALLFFSQLNNDSYTRRSFEIPAAGTFMLSQFTEDMNSMFKEDVEAAYFRCKEEMLDKIRFYLANDAARTRIAQAGRARLLQDGHEVTDRAREVLGILRGLSG